MGKVDAQGSMVQMVSLEQLVPQGHILRKLEAVLNLGFVPGFLQKAYPSNDGNPGVDPILGVRMILLSYFFNLSDVRLCDEVNLHAGYRFQKFRWFQFPAPDLPNQILLWPVLGDPFCPFGYRFSAWVSKLPKRLFAVVDASIHPATDDLISTANTLSRLTSANAASNS